MKPRTCHLIVTGKHRAIRAIRAPRRLARFEGSAIVTPRLARTQLFTHP